MPARIEERPNEERPVEILHSQPEAPEHTDRAILDQEWSELLNEVRVILPGTGVLFGFLLSIPFSGNFHEIADSDKHVYFTAFMSAALATLFLVAPSAQHRILWRRQMKNQQLHIATAFALAGTICLSVTISSVVFLITTMLYHNVLPAIATLIASSFIVLAWYALPLTLRLTRNRRAGNPSQPRDRAAA